MRVRARAARKYRVEVAAVSLQFWAVLASEGTRPHSILPAVAAGLVAVAGFAALVAGSRSYVWLRPAAGEPYNLVVEGFRSGHAWIAKEAPPALAAAANPYDFATYRPYLGPPWSVIDLSYYRGRLYAYFGVTPAVVLFWPYRAITGAWLHQAFAVLIFCVAGYAALLGVAAAAWRRYFPGVGALAGAAIALLLASVTTLPVFVVRPGVYEVSISCAFAFTMLALAALWNFWHGARRRCAWLCAASLAYGLAVGARPSLLFGASVLFLPAAAALWTALRGRGPQPWARYLVAALVPISAVGAGLAAYNYARFGDPMQFGHDYQLSGNNVYGTKSFAPRFFWDNVRLYFTEPLRWHRGFPFVWEPATPPLARGHLPVEFFFGTLTNLPILLAATLVPLAWMDNRRRGNGALAVPGITATLLVLFLASAVPICCYAGATSRYMLDFIPALALLAVLGLLGLERVLQGDCASRPGLARRSALAPVLRVAVSLALAYSVAMAWLLAFALSAFYRGAEEGIALLNSGRIEDGIAACNRVCLINPDFKGQSELLIGMALLDKGRPAEGLGFLISAAIDEPGVAAAHFNLGRAYLASGRFADSAGAFRRATELDPLDAEAEADLGVALFRMGLLREAIEREKAALLIEPNLAGARRNLDALESLAAGRGPGR